MFGQNECVRVVIARTSRYDNKVISKRNFSRESKEGSVCGVSDVKQTPNKYIIFYDTTFHTIFVYSSIMITLLSYVDTICLLVVYGGVGT